jgi:hypothetical protein
MLALIILTFGVFTLLWVGDFYLTLKTTKKLGYKAEINPIMRMALRFRGKYVWLFKIFEFGIFLYLILFLTNFNNGISFYALLAYIFFYSVLVVNNNNVYYKVTGKKSLVIDYIFIGLSIYIILFIYLNYLFYSDLVKTYGIISSYQTSYSSLYQTCKQLNATGASPLPQSLLDTLKSLNIKIP